MYSYISGTLEEVREDLIVVDNHGIGYQIQVPLRIHDELPAVGSQVKIYTYLHVREDAFMLFGFSSQDEIAMFKLLLNISGIGPKGALALLSTYSANEIRFAVVSEDDKLIAKAPGIGNKTAQRLIIELKDKISLEDAVDILGGSEPIVGDGGSLVKRETMEALVALGYTSSDASRVLSGIEISEDDDVETVLKQALKNMAMI
ncbi:MAG: Holliday junction branch migration protein RuvA [Lachnospiraceae bacterium]|nr:Holliday junction branch migration protein RuvA [Lachnospiraceae bacterium]